MDTALEIARVNVIRAEQLVAKQERIVEERRREGRDTRSAEKLLGAFRRALQYMREQFAREEERAAFQSWGLGWRLWPLFLTIRRTHQGLR